MGNGILLLVIVAAPFAASLLAAFLPLKSHNAAATLAGATALLGIIIAVVLYPAIGEGGIVRLVLPWIPELGLDLSLRLDGFSWMFTMLVTGIGLLVVLYARYYMSPEDPVPRFFSFFLAFMGAMLGVVLSGNLIQLVFFWELTSLFSFLLIGYWHHNARRARRRAHGAHRHGGGRACACSPACCCSATSSAATTSTRCSASGDAIRASPLYLPALVLVLLGALTKSAQFPFHFWLPHAMAAPTPVSAYLHSATMVKAGVFLLARLWPVLAGTRRLVLDRRRRRACVRCCSAPTRRSSSSDLKGLLAYSTISHLGLITLLLGLNSPLARGRGDLPHHQPRDLQGVAVHGRRHHRPRDRHARHPAAERPVPLHADHRDAGDGRRRRDGGRAAAERLPVEGDVLRRDGVRRSRAADRSTSRLPLVATAGRHVQRRLFAALHPRRVLRPAAERTCRATPHEPPRWMRVPIELLVLACLVVGIVPGADRSGPLLDAAVRPVARRRATPAYSLARLARLHPPLVMSLVALVGGPCSICALQPSASARGAEGVAAAASVRRPAHLRAACSSRCRGAGARRLRRCSGTRRLQPQLRCWRAVALLAGAVAALAGSGRAARMGRPRARSDAARSSLLWVVGGACARRRGLAGQVPSARRADAARRRRARRPA